MQFHAQQAARSLILLGFSVLIYMLHFTGKIYLFINPKYLLLSQAAAFLFLLLFFIQLTRVWTIKGEHDHDSCSHMGECCSHDDHHDHFHDHGTTPFSVKKLLSYSIIVLPLLSGFFLPAKVLDSAIADKKGAMLSIAGSSKSGQGNQTTSETTEQADSQETNEAGLPAEESDDSAGQVPEGTETATGYENQMTDEEYNKKIKELETGSTIIFNDSIYSSYYEKISSDINKFQGRKVSLYGFVYKEEGFTENQLVVSRFLVTHCVADASIIGFLSEFPDAAKIEKDTWIKIEGVIEAGSYMDTAIPLVKVSKWEITEEPAVPYLYPVTIKRE
ncbi:TIGR03943 family protein [Mesobacillus subterraneus]|uniref:TIGR03943 family putative permease subunit n=1 Tax=Mesobacillus subterraneus TaxID=285983 RepID=UPI001CFDB3FF|nr:TIGR03943 family protein [Mesobacillus subterraneus]WLR54768.1 TIGR03943 family protein [Mesobacillus subterraneus]